MGGLAGCVCAGQPAGGAYEGLQDMGTRLVELRLTVRTGLSSIGELKGSVHGYRSTADGEAMNFGGPLTC